MYIYPLRTVTLCEQLPFANSYPLQIVLGVLGILAVFAVLAVLGVQAVLAVLAVFVVLLSDSSIYWYRFGLRHVMN